MSDQPYDFFGEICDRYFGFAVDTYPQSGASLVRRLFTLTDDLADRLVQTRHAALAWSQAETPNAHLTSEVFLITQHGLVYAAGLTEAHCELHYLCTPRALFDPFVDQVDSEDTGADSVVLVDARLSADLAAAHPMDVALRRILDEHAALRVDLPA